MLFPPSFEKVLWVTSLVYLARWIQLYVLSKMVRALNHNGDGRSSYHATCLFPQWPQARQWAQDRSPRPVIPASTTPSENYTLKELSFTKDTIFWHVYFSYQLDDYEHYRLFCDVVYKTLWVWYFMGHLRNSRGLFGHYMISRWFRLFYTIFLTLDPNPEVKYYWTMSLQVPPFPLSMAQSYFDFYGLGFSRQKPRWLEFWCTLAHAFVGRRKQTSETAYFTLSYLFYL